MMRRKALSFGMSVGLVVLGLTTASCGAILGIDKDYHGVVDGSGGTCGDGAIDPGEECDDKNGTANDGCTQCVVDCDLPPGQFEEPETHHCYRLVTTPTAWQAADDDCVAWGGHLASITSETENTFVAMHVSNDVWLGATDAVMEGTFVWLDGQPLSFTDWESGQPNDDNGTEDCVETTGGGDQWNDDDCPKAQSYLCERTPAGGN